MKNTTKILVKLAAIFGFSFLFTVSISANVGPSIEPIASQYAYEGQQISIDVTATDEDGDEITLWATNRPANADFVDNGDGTGSFVWTPDYSGPNSSENSPFAMTIWASDGELSSSSPVAITVSNTNRSPEIIAPEMVDVQSGQNLNFNVTGSDPDGDQVSWNVIAAPEFANYTIGSGVTFDWNTVYADSGNHEIKVELIDEFGAADTHIVIAQVAQTTVYALSIDEVSGYPGDLVEIDVRLENLEFVAGFNLVINYESSSLLLVGISTADTRAEDFEYFTYSLDYRNISGDVNLVGVADQDDDGTPGDIEAGDGSLVKLRLYLPSSTEYAGFSIPIDFAFRDVLAGMDNTMTMPDGSTIEQDMIQYTDGLAQVLGTTEAGIGDINLNGIAYEISDAIYLTNFFINPGSFPLTGKARLNSDVNRDGLTGTVADLVHLINRIVNGISKPVPTESFAVSIGYDESGLIINSPSELGGLAVTMEFGNPEGIDRVESELTTRGLQLKYHRDGQTLRALIYSEDGLSIPSGQIKILEFDNDVNFEIKEVQAASIGGYMVETILKDESIGHVPNSFVLHQNYPNPFNPSTELTFELPHQARVNLVVLNVLGREVSTLVSGILPSGMHTVSWDGRDNNNQPVSSGIYFYRLTADDFSNSKKMLLIK